MIHMLTTDLNDRKSKFICRTNGVSNPIRRSADSISKVRKRAFWLSKTPFSNYIYISPLQLTFIKQCLLQNKMQTKCNSIPKDLPYMTTEMRPIEGSKMNKRWTDRRVETSHKDDVQWRWCESHQSPFTSNKRVLCSEILSYRNCWHKTKISWQFGICRSKNPSALSEG